MMMWGPAMMVFGAVFWVVVITAVIVGVWLLLGQRRPRALLGREEDRALEILRERYARGDISREEFEARRRDLTT